MILTHPIRMRTETVESQQILFACSQCGQRYRWGAQNVGRKLRCRCGHKFRVPQDAQRVPRKGAVPVGVAESTPASPNTRPASTPSSSPPTSSSGETPFPPFQNVLQSLSQAKASGDLPVEQDAVVSIP